MSNNILKNTLHSLILISASISAAIAAPIDPSIRNVEAEFTNELVSKFYLYGDTEDPNLIWFVPKFGTIARDITGFNQPEFDIGSTYSEHPDYFPGEELVWFSGAFDTRGLENDMQLLSQYASQKGYRIYAAKPKAAETFFVIDGVDVQSLDLDCSGSISTPNGDFPVCYVFDQQGRKHPAEFVAKLESKLPENTMSHYVGFRGITVPYWKQTLKELMGYNLPVNDPAVGQNWDDKIQVVTVWELDTHYNRSRGRININWPDLVHQFVLFQNAHPALLTVSDIQRKIREWVKTALVAQNAPFYLHTYSSDNDINLITDAIYKVLKDRQLFAPQWVFTRNPIHTNVPATAKRSEQRMIPIANGSITFFVPATVVAKPELRFAINRSAANLPRQDIDLYFGPSILTVNPQTNMSIECLHGGWNLPVRWAQNPACMDTYSLNMQRPRISREALQKFMYRQPGELSH
ncbi:hypothetical protein L4174_018515 [Photobacterium sp. CCB-ST2H9]|uniref:hypothetical protein n=1 Tax=Photobacterium sp. CCB-ST2H9 TaxID=2912855 RepID=UPI00200603F0|nr:hypothetical protein [Photobacterium sp. CCB-ST2H9]UTM60055.1 hypothetical protein L4174_018515 [Photobacterium sp. CCB-ST2H9]